MIRYALIGLTALALAGCGEAGPATALEQPSAPPPGALPAGVYTGPPLARLPNGPILWSSGEAAKGDGVTQVEGAKADYRRLARANGGLLACGLKETKTEYFSGLTGRRSCILHGPGGGGREILPQERKGQRGFQDIAVREGVLVATSGETIVVRELATGRSLGKVRTAGAQSSLRLPTVSIATGPSVRSGPAALISTPSGLVHVRLLDHGRGWRVWSQSVSWTDRAVTLGAPSSARLPPELARAAHDLKLVGGGLDGRRFLLGREHPRRFFLVELAGLPSEAVVRWFGEPPDLADLDVEAVAEDGLVGLGAHGPAGRAAYLIDLRGREPAAAALPPNQPACAVTRRPGQPPLTTVRFISGTVGLEVVTEWPGRLARCWSTHVVQP